MSNQLWQNEIMKNRFYTTIDELEAYCELGMARECLTVARKILRRKQTTAAEFSLVIRAILIQASHLRRWRGGVELAFSRFEANDLAIIRPALFDFYVALSDWKKAYEFRPTSNRNCTEMVFLMWALLELKLMREANTLLPELVEKLYCDEPDDFEKGCL